MSETLTTEALCQMGSQDGSWGVQNLKSFASGAIIKPGFLNWRPDSHGKPCGYTCEKLRDDKWPWSWGPWTKTIWQFELNQPHPLMMVMEDGLWIKPSRDKFSTDFGSIPPPIRSLPGLSESRFLLGYLFHDCIYGLKEHWIWASADGGVTWLRKTVTRGWTDNMLRQGIKHDPLPGGVVIRNEVWVAVSVFGGLSWAK